MTSSDNDHPPYRTLRWAGSIATVLALHWMIYDLIGSLRPVAPSLPPDAVLLDLTPAPEDKAPLPPLQPAIATPPPVAAPPPAEPVQPALTPPPPEPVPPAADNVPLPPPPPPHRRPAQTPSRPTTRDAPAPITAPSPPLAAPPASAPLAVAAPSPEAAATWQARLLAHLSRFKRFPVAAQRRGEQGVALMRFRMDRAGHILAVAVARGTGYADLDEEAQAWISRAEPLPPPPPDLTRPSFELTVPLRFTLQ